MRCPSSSPPATRHATIWLKRLSICSRLSLLMLSAKLWGVSGPCLGFVLRCASPRLVKPSSTCRALKPTNSIKATLLKSQRGNSFIDWPPKSTLSRYSNTNCTVGTSTRCTPGNLICSSIAIMPISSRNTKNSSSSPASRSIVHLLDLFSRVEGLRHPPIISPRQLPVQPFHHRTWRALLLASLLLCSLAHVALLFPVPYHLLLLLATPS